jgi:chromate transporter
MHTNDEAPLNPPMSDPTVTSDEAQRTPRPTLFGLFRAFFFVGLTGFGGVLPWTRRMVVERARWLSAEEFAEILPVAQLLPGPNVANIATLLGQRYHGAKGTLVALTGLYFCPAFVMVGIGYLYARWSAAPVTISLLAGLMPAATGLVIATSFKLVGSLPRTWRTAVFVVLPAVAVGILQLSLLGVLLTLGPLAVWLARRGAAQGH